MRGELTNTLAHSRTQSPRASPLHGVDDERPCTIRLFEDVLVAETHDGDSVRAQNERAPGVVLFAVRGVVRGAVDFDAELQGGAIEVEDVPVHRMLAPELAAFEIAMTEPVPDPLLGARGQATQIASV